jgi:iron complex transport system substrate-binding protein
MISIARGVLGLVALLAAAQVMAQILVRDDMDRPLNFRGKAQRIVTLAPFLTELVFAAGAGDRLVGVSDYSEYPPEAKKLAVVPTGAAFSMEKMALLKPDLVLAWRDGIRREDIERLTFYGATVFVAQARRLEDVPRLLKMIALLTGNDVTAAVDQYERKLANLRRENAAKPLVYAFMEIWNEPLTTISGTHFMSEALEICHAQNVFKERAGVAPAVTWDELYERNPYVIIGAGSASNAAEFRANWTVRQALTAVKADRLIYLDIEAIQRPTVRTPDGIAQLCAALDKLRPVPAPPPPRPTDRPSQYGL